MSSFTTMTSACFRPSWYPNFVQALSEFLIIYFVSRRSKDFTGANVECDLWVGDEFSGYELDVETLNMLLDGQKMWLDTKYGRMFKKRKNVPIILLGNSLPYNYNVESFRSRVFELHFFSDCSPIDPTRLAATIYYSCVKFCTMCWLPVKGDNILFTFMYTDPFTDRMKELLKICFGRQKESLEELDALRLNPSFRDGVLSPFVVFGLYEDVKFLL